MLEVEHDFEISARNVLSLVKAKLACGANADAIELIRSMLIEAHRIGMRKALKSEGLI
jgi:hypothetical protein